VLQLLLYEEFGTFLYFRFMTLNSGDLILTGTPPGVGCFRKPPMWLKVSLCVCVNLAL
jgi:hypothetical protein